jgi:hypothetical protein
VSWLGRVVRTVGTGALATYFLDPDMGPRRRALVRDQVDRFLRLGREEVRRGVRDASNRMHGAVAEAQGGDGQSAAFSRLGELGNLPPAARVALPVLAAAAVGMLPRLIRPGTAIRLASLAALGAAVGSTERARQRSVPGARSGTARVESARGGGAFYDAASPPDGMA